MASGAGGPEAQTRREGLLGQRLSKLELGAIAIVILLSVPTRSMLLSKSIWLDEAWVANSVLEPTWRQMFFYERWAQTTPPLVLTLMRGAVYLLGPGEIAFRIVPFIAGVAAVLVFALAAGRIFSASVALLATTFFSTNYWAIKYSQQVKQYGTDLLVATIFVYLVNDLAVRYRRRAVWLLVLACAAGSFLSVNTVFWVPSVIFVVAWHYIRNIQTGAQLSPILGSLKLHKRLLAEIVLIAGVFGICLGTSYFVFFHRNVTRSFSKLWVEYTLGSGTHAWQKALKAFSTLLVPPVDQIAYPVGLILLALICISAFRAVRGAQKGERLSAIIILTAIAPLAIAFLLSIAKLVPLGNQQRVIIWALPELLLLLCYAVHLGFKRYTRSNSPAWRGAIILSCIAIAAITIPIVSRFSTKYYLNSRYGNEDNRGAVELLVRNMVTGDCVFVSGAVSEQFDYYTRLLSWRPPCTRLSGFEWQCCSKNWQTRISIRGMRSLKQEVGAVVASIPVQTLWFFGRTAGLPRLREIMSEQGYSLAARAPFGSVVVYVFQRSAINGPPSMTQIR